MEDEKRPVAKSGATIREERRARLAVALRENLRKRKAQARARAITGTGANPDPLAPDEGGSRHS